MNSNLKTYFPFLDGIRGIAILAVFLFHSLGPAFGHYNLQWDGWFRNFDASILFLALYPLTYGSAGVAVFFVVSGFCIHLSHQRSKEKGWLLFANKRFFRIYPPYLLAVFVFFFIWPWGSLRIPGPMRLEQLFTHLFNVHNFSRNTLFGINGSFWSIAVELQLYALYPLLLIGTRKIGWKWTLAAVGALEITMRLIVSIIGFKHEIPLLVDSKNPLIVMLVLSPITYWLSWSIGAYLCDCHLAGRSSRIFRIRFDLMCLIAFSLPLFKPTAAFTFLAFSLLTAISIDRLLRDEWTFPKNFFFQKIWSHLGFLGVISYSFYLFHQPIIKLTGRILQQIFPESLIHPLVKFSACVAWYPIVLLISFLVFRLIERPSMELGKLIWKMTSKQARSTARSARPASDVHK